MSPPLFAAHCRWLAKHRRVVDLDTALRLMDRRGRLPRHVTSLTFDDAIEGLYEHAFPVLRELALPATVFVVTRTLDDARPVDWVDDAPPWPLRTMSGDQILDMAAAGIRFASHSHHHRVLTDLSQNECEQDLYASREALEDHLHAPVRHLAYPRGRHAPHVEAAAQMAGFTHAFALPDVREDVGPYSLPRVGVYAHNGLSTLRVKAARPYLTARLSGAYPAARAAKRALTGRRRTPVGATR